MKYIKYWTSSNYPEPTYRPSIFYSLSIDYLYFEGRLNNETNDKRFALVGDYVLAKADGSKLFVGKSVYNTKYKNDSTWKAIATVVIPYNGFGDKTVRCASLRKMSLNDPQQGSPDTMYHGGGISNPLPDGYLNGLYIYCTGEDINGQISNTSDANKYAIASQLGSGYKRSKNPRASYEEGSSDRKYSITVFVNDDVNDFLKSVPRRYTDGKYNTDIAKHRINVDITGPSIVNSYDTGYCPAFSSCLRYYTVGTEAGDWYLPSIYELLAYCENAGKTGFLYESNGKIASSTCTSALDYFFLCSSDPHIEYRDVQEECQVLAFLKL